MKTIIELVKTTQGYAVLEDGHEVNKVSNRNTKEKQLSAAPKKFSQQNFTIYPYLFCREPEYLQKYIVVPAKSQWFNMNQIHQIQKKALPEWFKTKKVVFGAAKPDKFEKNEQLYKKYRNYIIDLARNEYLSPTSARKGLAGDACAIIRIHSFLQKNGLINYVFPKKTTQTKQLTKIQQDRWDSSISLVKRKDCVDRQKSIFQKHFDKDHLELLKKITKKYRPICHLCEGVCGVLWYQYSENLILKTFEKVPMFNKDNNNHRDQESQERKVSFEDSSKTKIVNSQQSFRYLLRFCSSCFTSGNLPIVLSYNDFKKYSVLDDVSYHYEESKDKKKINQQNKLIEFLQKNRFNIKKTSQALKISEKQVYTLLLCLPLIKIQKLARIDQQSQIQQENQANNLPNGIKNSNIKQEIGMQAEPSLQKQVKNQIADTSLLQEFKKQLQHINDEEVKLYEQFVQLWLLKINTKLTKLADWEKGTKWFAEKLIDDQKNNLATVLKQTL